MIMDVVKGGSMGFLVLLTLTIIGGYCTRANPIQIPEKRIFCNLIGCASKRSHESSGSIDAFDDTERVAHKKDLSAENLWPRPAAGPAHGSLREQLRQAWMAGSQDQGRRLHDARGRHAARKPSATDSELSFWREMQSGWPAYEQRVRRETRNILKRLRTQYEDQVL